MQLNHLNLCVPHVAQARDFFTQHFGFRCLHQQGEQLAVLQDEQGFAFTLSNFSGKAKPSYPPELHIGFHLSSVQEVEAAYARLLQEGVPLGQPPREHHGSHVFYFKALETIPVEVGCLLPNAQ